MPFHLARLGADPRDERPRPTRNYKVRKPMANQYSGTPPKVISIGRRSLSMSAYILK